MSNGTMNKQIEITGNTYPVKDKLKALGAKWNADKKCWTVDAAKADEAKAIVSAAGPKQPYSSGSGYSRGFTGSARYYGGRSSRKCRTGGNCSSFGNGRSCGAEDCDGY